MLSEGVPGDGVQVEDTVQERCQDTGWGGKEVNGANGQLKLNKTRKKPVPPPPVKPRPSTSERGKLANSKPPLTARKPNLVKTTVEDNTCHSTPVPSEQRQERSPSSHKLPPPVAKRKLVQPPAPQTKSEELNKAPPVKPKSKVAANSQKPIERFSETAKPVEEHSEPTPPVDEPSVVTAAPQISKPPPPKTRPRTRKPPIPSPRGHTANVISVQKNVNMQGASGSQVETPPENAVTEDTSTQSQKDAEELEMSVSVPQPGAQQEVSPQPKTWQEASPQPETQQEVSPQPETQQEVSLGHVVSQQVIKPAHGFPNHAKNPVDTCTSSVDDQETPNEVNLDFLKDLDILDCIQDLESEIDKALGVDKTAPDLTEYSDLIQSLKTLDTTGTAVPESHFS